MQGIDGRGLVLLGCGKMGSAMLAGWLEGGLRPGEVWVQDPHPSDWLRGTGVNINGTLPPDPAIFLIAVKPQIMDAALDDLGAFSGRTLVVSVAAGIPIARFEAVFGAQAPIIRTIPNTPAAVGKGITALIGNAAAGEDDLALAERLLSVVGQTVRLETEAQMDAVTALSGSGPAYVFHLIEAMAAAGEAQGLPADMALNLARATVAGAGALAEQSTDDPGTLRANVTSPGGTTEAALRILMDEAQGFPALLRRAMQAAADRSRELAK